MGLCSIPLCTVFFCFQSPQHDQSWTENVLCCRKREPPSCICDGRHSFKQYSTSCYRNRRYSQQYIHHGKSFIQPSECELIAKFFSELAMCQSSKFPLKEVYCTNFIFPNAHVVQACPVSCLTKRKGRSRMKNTPNPCGESKESSDVKPCCSRSFRECRQRSVPEEHFDSRLRSHKVFREKHTKDNPINLEISHNAPRPRPKRKRSTSTASVFTNKKVIPSENDNLNNIEKIGLSSKNSTEKSGESGGLSHIKTDYEDNNVGKTQNVTPEILEVTVVKDSAKLSSCQPVIVLNKIVMESNCEPVSAYHRQERSVSVEKHIPVSSQKGRRSRRDLFLEAKESTKSIGRATKSSAMKRKSCRSQRSFVASLSPIKTVNSSWQRPDVPQEMLKDDVEKIKKMKNEDHCSSESENPCSSESENSSSGESEVPLETLNSNLKIKDNVSVFRNYNSNERDFLSLNNDFSYSSSRASSSDENETELDDIDDDSPSRVSSDEIEIELDDIDAEQLDTTFSYLRTLSSPNISIKDEKNSSLSNSLHEQMMEYQSVSLYRNSSPTRSFSSSSSSSTASSSCSWFADSSTRQKHSLNPVFSGTSQSLIPLKTESFITTIDSSSRSLTDTPSSDVFDFEAQHAHVSSETATCQTNSNFYSSPQSSLLITVQVESHSQPSPQPSVSPASLNVTPQTQNHSVSLLEPNLSFVFEPVIHQTRSRSRLSKQITSLEFTCQTRSRSRSMSQQITSSGSTTPQTRSHTRCMSQQITSSGSTTPQTRSHTRCMSKQITSSGSTTPQTRSRSRSVSQQITSSGSNPHQTRSRSRSMSQQITSSGSTTRQTRSHSRSMSQQITSSGSTTHQTRSHSRSVSRQITSFGSTPHQTQAHSCSMSQQITSSGSTTHQTQSHSCCVSQQITSSGSTTRQTRSRSRSVSQQITSSCSSTHQTWSCSPSISQQIFSPGSTTRQPRSCSRVSSQQISSLGSTTRHTRSRSCSLSQQISSPGSTTCQRRSRSRSSSQQISSPGSTTHQTQSCSPSSSQLNSPPAFMLGAPKSKCQSLSMAKNNFHPPTTAFVTSPIRIRGRSRSPGTFLNRKSLAGRKPISECVEPYLLQRSPENPQQNLPKSLCHSMKAIDSVCRIKALALTARKFVPVSHVACKQREMMLRLQELRRKNNTYKLFV